MGGWLGADRRQRATGNTRIRAGVESGAVVEMCACRASAHRSGAGAWGWGGGAGWMVRLVTQPEGGCAIVSMKAAMADEQVRIMRCGRAKKGKRKNCMGEVGVGWATAGTGGCVGLESESGLECLQV